MNTQTQLIEVKVPVSEVFEEARAIESQLRQTTLDGDDPHVRERAAELILLCLRKATRQPQPC